MVNARKSLTANRIIANWSYNGFVAGVPRRVGVAVTWSQSVGLVIGHCVFVLLHHYNDVTMGAIASLFRCRSKKTSKLRVTGRCGGIHWWPVNSPHKWQLRGKCFHLMTSSWSHFITLVNVSGIHCMYTNVCAITHTQRCFSPRNFFENIDWTPCYEIPIYSEFTFNNDIL